MMTIKKKDHEDPAPAPSAEPEGHDRKSERFFAKFREASEYTINLYRIGERGAKEWVEVYENSAPDLARIRRDHGPGKYTMYAHHFDGTFLDSVTVSIAAPAPGAAPAADGENVLLERLAKYRALLGGAGEGKDQTALILKLAENQAQMMGKISELINAQSQQFLKMQMDAQQKTADLMLKMSEKKSDLGDIAQIYNFVNELKGDAGAAPEAGWLAQLAPLAGPILTKILTPDPAAIPPAPGAGPGAAPALPVPRPGRPAPVTAADLPAKFRATVTRGTRAAAVARVAQYYNLEEPAAAALIDAVLAEKGA